MNRKLGDHSGVDHHCPLCDEAKRGQQEAFEKISRRLTDEPNTVIRSSRQVIEHKVLTAIGDPSTVVILASREDLDMLIDRLSTGTTEHAAEWCASMKQLRREAFGG